MTGQAHCARIGFMTADPAFALLTAEEFLAIDFGPDRKAELDHGVIRMMTGGSVAHGRVQANIMRVLGNALRGSGCRPYGSDTGVWINEKTVRYPDVSVHCGVANAPESDGLKALSEPRVVIEVLSPTTNAYDQGAKLADYQALPSIETIAFVDPENELVRTVQRLGPGSWRDDRFSGPHDLALPGLGVVIPHTELFARD